MNNFSKILLIALAVFGVIALYVRFIKAPSVYDKAVAQQERVDEAWSNVQSAYQRRADLIPNLVNTVKGAAENEKEILTQVTQARAGIVNAKTPEDMEMMGKKINTAINLAFERYPQIRSTENFQALQVQLEGTENRINKSRNDYNEVVKNYNTFIRGYWKKMFISWIAEEDEFSKKEGFKAKEGSEDAPEVKF